MKPLTDEQRQAAADHYAFAERVARHRLTRLGRRLDDAARSAMHEALMNAVAGHRPERKRPLRSWIAMVVRKATYRAAFRPTADARLFDGFDRPDHFDPPGNATTTATEDAEAFEHLLGLSRFEGRKQEMLRMIYAEGYSQGETAARLGVSQALVSQTDRKAQSRIRAALQRKAGTC